MGRVKKGKSAVRKDLWENAGGVEALVKIMKSKNITRKETDYSAAIWSEISLAVFGKDDPKNRHWLWVVWTKNRRGVRDLISPQNKKSKGQEDIDKVEEAIDIENIKQNKKENLVQGNIQAEDNITDEEFKNTEEDKQENSDQENIQAEHNIADEESKNNKEDEKENSDQENIQAEENIADEESKNTEEDEQENSDQENIQAEDNITDEESKNTEEDEQEKSGQEKIQAEDNIKDEQSKNTTGPGFQQNIDQWRKLPVVSKQFTITIKQEEWQKILPLQGSMKLRRPWTNILYNSFRKSNPSCTIAFKSQHIKTTHSRKMRSPYLHISAICTFPSCGAKYIFKMKRRPFGNSGIKISVQQRGEIKHKKSEKQFRPAAYTRRGRIARALSKGVSNFFYSKLEKTPVAELISGNITRSLNKNVLKVIKSEFSKSKKIHDDVFMEMYLTQKIIKECDTQFHKIPGYIQHLQIDPFGVHMYTETSINILVQHLRKKTPLALYLDATGNVASKVTGQTRRLLYYALTLPGGGRDAPPLPVCEMLTNEHSIPPITFWLMQFLRHLSQYTKLKIHQVETDYSWALMNSVLLSFNKESIFSYLDRAFEICSGQMILKDTSTFTVLHICSAHVLKAVANSIGRKTEDKGLRAFATFTFARLQNTTSMTGALNIFRSLCSVLCSKHNSNSVLHNLKVIQALIREGKTPDMDKTEKLDDSQLAQEEDDEDKRKACTIISRSPFTHAFKDVFEEVKRDLGKEDAQDQLTDNPYFCPGIVDILFQSYMGIYPLWSGLLLGDLKRHASNNVEIHFGPRKTRDTNCHVERWFGIIKHSILKKQRRLTPGTFIRTMYGTLQGRYREHIMSYNLSEKLLLKQGNYKDITQSKEGWAKRDGDKPCTGKSKYFSIPSSVPVPKRAKSDPSTGTSQKTSEGTALSKEVNRLWTSKPTEVVVAVLRNVERKQNITLTQREFQSLRPHELLIGEVIESYIGVILNAKDNAGRLYQLNHYTMGPILHGTREQVASHALKSVTFDDYDGIIGFVNINNDHWKFVYLHALSNQIFVVDPLQESNEVEDSREADSRFEQYFKMRRNRLGKEEWVNIKWQPGMITHTFQKDGTSCGIFVMQMAKMTVMEFPNMPKSFPIKSSKKCIKKLREDMAEEILQGSVSRDEFCSFCGNENLLNSAVDPLWIQCETCQRWFHTNCLGMTPAQMPNEETPWDCVLCCTRHSTR